MIHGLFRRQPGNRRQHAKGIGGEKDHVSGMPAKAGDNGVLNELNRVSRARVLSLAVVVVIGDASVGIEDDVLEHTAETQRVPDLRFVFLGALNALGVASALDVNNSIGALSMPIVPDQIE